MKKEFSFYEFVGIIVPGVTLLFFSEMIFEYGTDIDLVDFSKIGESLVFVVVAYGIGHILQSVGNAFESIFWRIFGGMPTQWLTKKGRFQNTLFDSEQTNRIMNKIHNQFGEKKSKDYGRDVYNWLSLKERLTEKRIDVFNANYSLFRGLATTFYILSGLSLWYLGWQVAVIALLLGLLSNYRMFRFAKLYAKEIYRSYLNYQHS